MSHYHEIFHQGISFNTPEHIERLQKYMYSGQPQIVELNTTVDLYRRTFETERPKGASFQNVGGNLVANLNGVPFQMRNGVYFSKILKNPTFFILLYSFVRSHYQTNNTFLYAYDKLADRKLF